MSKGAENETKNCEIRAENVEAKDFWNLENGLERQEQLLRWFLCMYFNDNRQIKFKSKYFM